MSDIEKLKELTEQIDKMLEVKIHPSSEEFVKWRTKTGRLLSKIFGEGSAEHKEFEETKFHVSYLLRSTNPDAENRRSCHESLQTVKAKLTVYLEELEENEEVNYKGMGKDNTEYHKVFIVHGHDGELKASVARLLEKQGIDAIILNEKANKGRTIIEKIEEYSEGVGAAVCLFTSDDVMADGSKRARQNVVFETGYFYGKIGRDKTIIIAEDETLNLSDLHGVVYVNRNNWEVDVLKELREIGYKINMNKL